LKITERTATVILSEEGREVLESAGVSLSEQAAVLAYIHDSDDIGIWTRIPREDGDHYLLVRWEYVLTIDFPAGETRTVGLRV
jgi:hypothetical protein